MYRENLAISRRNCILNDTEALGEGLRGEVVVEVAVEGDKSLVHDVIGPGSGELSAVTATAIYGQDFQGEFGRFVSLPLHNFYKSRQ